MKVANTSRLGVLVLCFEWGAQEGERQLATIEIENCISMSSIIHPTLKWKSLESKSKSTNNEFTPSILQ